MRIANVNGRAGLVVADGLYVDINTGSGGALSSDPQELFSQWSALKEWASTASHDNSQPFAPEDLQPPAPRPRQTVALGFNYDSHVSEIGYVRPSFPPVFTKFASSLTGAFADVPVPKGGQTDWEVELVLIIKNQATNLKKEDAWDSVAALAVGQDLSERKSQFEGQGDKPQYSLAKSFPGFGPIGPWAVSLDEIPDPSNLKMSTTLNGESMQSSSTSEMIYSVPELLAHLTSQLTLYPGDIIFTGTPAGVGFARSPQRFLEPGDVLVTEIEHVGKIQQRMV